MRLLDADRRRAIYAVYAFCRAVDDIADGAVSQSEKQAALKTWRDEVMCLHNGAPTSPVGQALIDVVKTYHLNQQDFLAIINGMETDAAGSVRMKDMARLYSYIDDVACAVGRLCTPIFGFPSEEGRALAKSLGEALQITNILRDLEEDAAIDRLYLPLDALADAGADIEAADTGTVVTSLLDHPACATVCDQLAMTASARFQEAADLLDAKDNKTARAPRLMMAAYRRLLNKIVQRGWQGPRSRTSLSLAEKVWIVLRYGWI